MNIVVNKEFIFDLPILLIVGLCPSLTIGKPYTSRIGLLNLNCAAALLFSPGGAEFSEPSTARARLLLNKSITSQQN